MKKLGKIEIKPEQVLNNEDLLNLKGGWDPADGPQCYCYYSSAWAQYNLNVLYSTPGECENDCRNSNPESSDHVYGNWGSPRF